MDCLDPHFVFGYGQLLKGTLAACHPSFVARAKVGQAMALRKHNRHFDLRIRVGRELVSWYGNTPPNLDPDHPTEITRTGPHQQEGLLSERPIPKGQRGEGLTMVVFHGFCIPKIRRHDNPDDDAEEQLEAGELEFTIPNGKLKGDWLLSRKGRSNIWELRKLRDEFASTSARLDFSRSSLSDRLLDQVGETKKAGTHSDQGCLFS